MNYSFSQAILGTSPISCSAPAEVRGQLCTGHGHQHCVSWKSKELSRGVDPGGGGGKHIVLPPPPNNFDNFKNSKYVMQDRFRKKLSGHYKTIKFNIKIQLNIHNFQFCGAPCAQNFILRLCLWSALKKN